MKDRPEFWHDPGFDPGREGRTYCGLRQPDGTTVVSVDGHPLDLRGDFRKQSHHMAEDRVQCRLTTILAADVVGYSRLMERDEAGTLKESLFLALLVSTIP